MTLVTVAGDGASVEVSSVWTDPDATMVSKGATAATAMFTGSSSERYTGVVNFGLGMAVASLALGMTSRPKQRGVFLSPV